MTNIIFNTNLLLSSILNIILNITLPVLCILKSNIILSTKLELKNDCLGQGGNLVMGMS